MRLLLDMHAFLWRNADDPTLGPRAREAIASGDNSVFVSAATAWEIATKRVAIEVAHAVRTAELPWHHRDPVDRLLVAQAQLDRLTLVTTDAQISRYDVALLDAGS